MQEIETLKEDLIASSEEFRGLYEEHQSCEEQLERLNRKSLLSQEDELEEKRLKRRKLTLKDRMYALLHDHRSEQAVA